MALMTIAVFQCSLERTIRLHQAWIATLILDTMKLTTNYRTVLLPMVLVAFIVCSSGFVSQAFADTTRDLQNAVHRLNIRLGQGQLADGWRKYLNLNVLETQAAKGPRADIGQLSNILNRFSSNANGLSLPVFNDVRVALSAQINQLIRIPSNDLLSEIAKARANYSQVPIAHLIQRRDQTVNNLRALGQFYNVHLDSSERELFDNDLQLEQLIGFLEGLEFELPPEISAGKLADQMSAVKKRIDDLEEKLGQLPEVEATEEPKEKVVPPQPDESNGDVSVDPPGGPTVDSNVNGVRPDAVQDSSGQDEPTQDESATDKSTQDKSPQDASAPDASAQEDAPAQQPSDDKIRSQRAQLEDEIAVLQKDYDDIKKLRDTIRKQDANRQKERGRVWRELTKYNHGFVEVAKRRNDNFFASSHYSFSKFALVYFFATDDNLQADYNEHLDRLGKEISKLNIPAERTAAATVGDVIGWLEATDLAPDLVATVKRKYSLPNLKISVSNDLVNQLASKPVSDGRPVNEWLFGRLIQGVAYSKGAVTIDFVDNPNEAQLSLHLSGNVTSQTYTKQGRITAYANATGSFDVRRTIALNIGGLVIGVPYGTASLASDFCGIDCRLRLIQRIADKQYRRDKCRNERESTRRMKKQVINQFTRESNETLGQAKNRLGQALKNSIDFGGYLPELYLRTTTDRLWAIGNKTVFGLTDTGRVSNLAAPLPAGGTSVNAHVAVQVHESLLSNYVDPFFANQTFTNNELAEWAEELTGKKTEGLATEEDGDEEPWSITFATVRPIQFEFEDNGFAVTISGRRFSQGDSKILAGLRIRVPFKITRINGKLTLIRDGDAKIDYADPDKKNAKIVAFKSFLETKLNSKDQTKAELRKGVELPENLIPVDEVEKLKEFPIARTLLLVELRMVAGWLHVGWNRVPPGSYASFAMDTPAIWFESNPPPEPVSPADSIQGVSPVVVPAYQAAPYPPVYPVAGCASIYQRPANGPTSQSPAYVPCFQTPCPPVYQCPSCGQRQNGF